MSEDYLWDRSGEPDHQIEKLEDILAPLRFEELPLVALQTEASAPEPTVLPVRRWWPTAVTAAAAVAAALLIWWWGFAIGSDQPHQVIVERVPVAGPPIFVAPAAPAAAAKDDDVPSTDEKAAGADDDAPAVPAEVSKTSASKRPKRPKARSALTRSKTKASGSAVEARRPEPGDPVDVACILDPAQCRRPDPNLPDKLSTSDIKVGIAKVKAAAKACGPLHGAREGTKVRAKLSISGRTGKVVSATAQAPHAGSPLGQCVASELKKATFPRFRKTSLGVVYPITM